MMLQQLALHAEGYSPTKQALGQTLGLSDDLLHRHVGSAIFVITALLLGRRMRSPWPLAAVAAFELADEIVGYADPESWSATRSALDVPNTIFWPAVLFLLARRGRGIGTKV